MPAAPRESSDQEPYISLIEASDVGAVLDLARRTLRLPALGALTLDRENGSVQARVSTDEGIDSTRDLGEIGFFESRNVGGWFADARPVSMRSSDVPPGRLSEVLTQVGEHVMLVPSIAGSQLQGFLVAPAGPPAEAESALSVLQLAAAALAAAGLRRPGSRMPRRPDAMRHPSAWMQADATGDVVASGGDWGGILGTLVDAGAISVETLGDHFGPSVTSVIARAVRGGNTVSEMVEAESDVRGSVVLAITPRPILDAQGCAIATVVDVADLTEMLGATEATQLADRLGSVVERLSKHAGFYHSRGTLCRELCRSLVEEAGYPQAWVASFDPSTGVTAPVAVYGGPRDHIPVLLEMINGSGPAHDAWLSRLAGDLPSLGRLSERPGPLASESASAGFSHVGVFRLDFERVPGTILIVYGDTETQFAAEPLRLLSQLSADTTLALERLSHLESQRIAQRERDEAYRQLATLINGSPAAIVAFDDHGVVTSINPAAVQLAGVSAEQMVGRSLLDLVLVPRGSALTSLVDAAVRGEMGDLHEGPLWIKGGSRRWIRAAAAVLRDGRGEAAGVVVVAMDATQEHQLARRMSKQERQLETLAAETVAAVDRQRREIAIGLHDGLGQTLAALKLKLRGVAAQDSSGALEESVALVDEAIAQTRTFTFEMYPSTLRELGLQAALEWLTERMEKQHGGSWAFVGRDVELDEERSAVMYRITRELLLNVVKHSGADEVLVMLSSHEGNVSVTVYDNGKGFSGNRASDGQGLGLFSVGVQLDRLGGQLEIDSFSGGSTVKATIPITRRRTGTRE